MEPNAIMQASAANAAPDGMPHLGGAAATLRQRMAAHFVDGLSHVVEIGGHVSPVSRYLTRVPQSFTCIDPKAQALDESSLNGQPCRVRHIVRKFQDVELDLDPGSYGLVFVGYSLKPHGARDPLGKPLFDLIGRSAITVIEYALKLDRAASQVGPILEQAGLAVVASVDFTLADGIVEQYGFEQRRLIVLRPEGQPGR